MSEDSQCSCVLVTDFDGTITKEDFFWLVVEKLLKKEDSQPWNDYLAGKITHFEAMNRIFRKIHLSEEDLRRFILDISFEDGFLETVSWCKSGNIPIYIASAGSDYYIKLLLEKAGIINDVNIIANTGVYDSKKGLLMLAPDRKEAYYSHDYGVDKEAVVKLLKNSYKTVVFAGDGIPDYYAARHADVVFARRTMLRLCKENGLACRELPSYCAVLEYLQVNCPC
jgi:2-hydroxy-3-keto-5-methylthiopentenyl-1-phosphate phosphatase